MIRDYTLAQSKILAEILDNYVYAAEWIDYDLVPFECYQSDIYPAASIQLLDNTAVITLDRSEDMESYEASAWAVDPETGETLKFDRTLPVDFIDDITEGMLDDFFNEAMINGFILY